MATQPGPGSRPLPLDRKFHGASSISNYGIEQKLGEGTFGEVYMASSKKTGSVVALKKILMHNEKEGFPITALREIKLLKMLSHVNVIKLEEMAIERTKESRKRATLYMVTPYLNHDLSGLLDNSDVVLAVPHIKCYMLQLLQGLKYLHNSHILHRDMKAANLLISNRGILKIADFGLARHYDDEVPRAGHGGGEAKRDYTALVVTRWYRPPELLLQLRRYTTAIDMWGAGCVFGEMFTKTPILSGTSDLNQAQKIWELVGSPNDTNMPGWNLLPGCDGVKEWENKTGNLEQKFGQCGDDAVALLRDLLKLDWRQRINAIDALEHPYFKNHPLPSRPEDIPWFQDSHELDRRNGQNGRGPNQPPPPAPAGGTVGGAPGGDWNGNGPPPSGAWENGGRGNRYPPGPPGSGPPHGSSRSFENRIPQAAYNGRGPPPPPPRHQPWQSEGSRVPHQLPQIPAEGLSHPLPPRPGQSAQLPREPPRDIRDSYSNRSSQSTRDSLPPRDSRDSRPPRDARDSRDSYNSRDNRDRQGDNRRSNNIDSYVPSYNGGGRRDRDRDRRSTSHQSADREDRYSRPPSRDSRRGGGREDYYDRDNPPRHTDSGRSRDQRRTRSRSPSRERERDRDRERDRSDFYRR